MLKPKLSSEIPQEPSRAERTEDDILKVSKIAQQVKRNDRYSIYINGKYSFSLSEYQLAGSGLHIGKVFTKTELDDFISESNFGKAYERALNYVMIRPRSEREIIDYLTRTYMYPKPKMFTDTDGQRHFKKVEVDKTAVTTLIQRVMERLSKKGYINDETFARAWINSRQLTKKTSKRKLEQELRAKHVDPDIIATTLQSGNIDELENLRALIAKKRRLPRYQDNVKLTQYLLRQGYNYDDIRNLIPSSR